MKHMRHRFSVFHDRHPRIGPVLWISSIQYFILQYVVARMWTTPFSLRSNVISDLGNTACGGYAGRHVCSPSHIAMNASFIALGLTMILGAIIIPSEFRRRRIAVAGFIAIALAGFGTMLVGLFPENNVPALHASGAFLPFVIGNLALLLFSFGLRLPAGFRWYTRVSGLIALTALVLFTSKQYLALGQGGMERLVAYPQTLWLIAYGVYVLMNHYCQKNNGNKS